MVNFCLHKRRYDCFIIWGNGYEYLEKILDIIREELFLNIVHIEKLNVKNINKLVKKVYDFDYAPFWHLKSKVSYLSNTRPVVHFIFVENKDVKEDYFGENAFRHIECRQIKRVKEKIRDQFNPRLENGDRTHHHVIHATDNQIQTSQLLKLLGYKDGIEFLDNPLKVIGSPHYIDEPNSFSVEEVNLDDIYCVNAILVNEKMKIEIIPINKSAQYLGLKNDEIYTKYLDTFRGTILKQDYNAKKFINLRNKFKYLANEFKSDFVIVQKMKSFNEFIILDGLHRASIHLYQGNRKIKVCII